MGLDPEARRGKRGEIARAALHLEHAVARPAAEVVVVAEVGQLVPRGLARELHGHSSAVIDHRP